MGPLEIGTTMHIQGLVLGTPRTYGNRKTEDAWRLEICQGQWTGCDSLSLPLTGLVEVTFGFRVNPRSPQYYGAVSLRGPDLDTMVVGAMDALVDGRNKTRPSTRLLQTGRVVSSISASKTLVTSDTDSGATIEIRPGVEHHYERHACDLGFDVVYSELRDLRHTVKNAAEQHNTGGTRAPAELPLHVRILWGSAFRGSNVHSADKLEAVIDGLGASVASKAGLRFFDPPPFSRFAEFGYDDSGVVSLHSTVVDDAPLDVLLRVEISIAR